MEASDSLTAWLLESQWPSIRYLALRQYERRSEQDTAVRAARQAIMQSGPAAALLQAQAEEGYWIHRRSYYGPKYLSTHWSMLLLALLRADPADERVQRGAQFMLDATAPELGQNLWHQTHGLSCFWGNLLGYSARFAPDDERTQAIISYLMRDALQGGWRCSINEELPCAWGAARALWGLSALPEEQRSQTVRDVAQAALRLLIADYPLHSGGYPTPGRVHALWSRISFPLFYQADILLVLSLAAEWGWLGHASLRPALDWLAKMRRPNGRWRGSHPFRRRTWLALADSEEITRWVSLQAALVLRASDLALENPAPDQSVSATGDLSIQVD